MRFANDKFKEMRQYVNTPHFMRTRGEGDPYYYGMREREWRDKSDALLVDILDRNISNQSIHKELVYDWGLSDSEAQGIIRTAMSNGVNRHVTKGVPHTATTEEIARLALEASGNPTRLINNTSVMSTDLESMIGNMKAYIDVQMNYPRRGVQQSQVIPIINSLSDGVSTRALREAPKSASLGDIIGIASNMSNTRPNYDKLMQSKKAFENGDITEDKIKDQLLVGSYDVDKVNNLAQRKAHGHFDPRAPRNLSVIDLNNLRPILSQMTRRDMLGEGIQLKDYNDRIKGRVDGKLKVQLPMNFIEKYGRPTTDVLDPQVINELNQLAP